MDKIQNSYIFHAVFCTENKVHFCKQRLCVKIIEQKLFGRNENSLTSLFLDATWLPQDHI